MLSLFYLKENELVLIDIDSGEVTIPASFNIHAFPETHLNSFKQN